MAQQLGTVLLRDHAGDQVYALEGLGPLLDARDGGGGHSCLPVGRQADGGQATTTMGEKK